METIANKYEIIRTLGEGGFGKVYLARHTELGDLYAIKLLKKNLSAEEDLIPRFKREASMIKKLLHPNSVTLRDFGKTEDGYFYMAMDFCEGEDLNTILEREGALNAHRVVRLVSQMLDLLEEAHHWGIVHRDLKPENILLETTSDGEDRIRILDFGIAKLLESVDDGSITKDGFIVGTPMFMSPEQAQSKPLDHRSDIYSLGLVMYSMLAGKSAFAPSSIITLLQAQAYEYPKNFKDLDPPLFVPPAVESLVFKAIQKVPADRFQNAAEFQKACSAYLNTGTWAIPEGVDNILMESNSLPPSERPSAPRTVLSNYSLSAQPSTSSRRNAVRITDTGTIIVEGGRGTLLPWVMVFFLLALLVGAFVFLSQFQPDRRPPKIFISSPHPQSRTRADFVEVKGRVEDRDPQVEIKFQRSSQSKMQLLRLPVSIKKPTKISIKKPTVKEVPKIPLGWYGEKMPQDIVKRTQRQADEPPLRKENGTPVNYPKEAKEYLRAKDGAIMVFVPGGNFVMGATPEDNEAQETERPQIFVILSGYYMDKYEVTYGQFQQFVLEQGYQTSAEKRGKSYSFALEKNEKGLSWKNPWPAKVKTGFSPRFPATHISYVDARAYSRWAEAHLPTEAQWEMAARGTGSRKYPWGPALPQTAGVFRANYNQKKSANDGYKYLAPVGSYEYGVSPYGLFDMAGNVYEWCFDGWKADSYSMVQNKFRGVANFFYPPSQSKRRVLKGGSWASGHKQLRSSFRSGARPTTTADNMGFRCVVLLLPSQKAKSQ